MSHPLIDIINWIVPMAVIAVDLVAVTQALSGSFGRRLIVASVGGSWVGLAMYFAVSGRLAFSPANQAPWMGILLLVPLLTVGLLALASEKARVAVLGISLEMLVGLNAMRILGVLFLLDFIARSVSGPFPFFAGLGDMITGALAIPLALKIARSKEPPVRVIAGWNAFGALDLIVAVGLGTTSVPGSPLQLIHAGVGSQAMQYLPMSLIPTVLVPFYLLTHAIVATQLRARSRSFQRTPSTSPTLNVACPQRIQARP